MEVVLEINAGEIEFVFMIREKTHEKSRYKYS
jgi:hypothetical protein